MLTLNFSIFQEVSIKYIVIFLISFFHIIPLNAFEVKTGECRQILSGKKAIKIHYYSGLKVEVSPVNQDNITVQTDIFPNGMLVNQKWIGGILPLESPQGIFVYKEKQIPPLEVGLFREFPFTFKGKSGMESQGTIQLYVKSKNKGTFGECEATYFELVLTSTLKTNNHKSVFSRLFVGEIGFFVESKIEQIKNGKSEGGSFLASMIELSK